MQENKICVNCKQLTEQPHIIDTNNNCTTSKYNIITEEIEKYKEFQEEIFDYIRKAKNITPDRVIAWGHAMETLQHSISTLEKLL